MKRPPSAVWLVRKPVGVTSFSLVETFRREHPAPRLKVMHGGALDPFAHGLVLLLVGSATRLFDRLHEVPKTYRARVVWGSEMDSGDLLGRPVRSGDATGLTPAALDAALRPLLGWTDQVPPATSNKWVDGERAYRKAHRGEVVELPPSRVYLHQARWTAHELPRSSELELVCAGGYYVRSLARDLGRALGCGAHLGALERTAIGPWSTPVGEPQEVTGRGVLPWLSSRTLSDDELGALRAGRSLGPGRIEPGEWALPVGFPPPRPAVRAFHHERVVALLDEQGGLERLLPKGV